MSEIVECLYQHPLIYAGLLQVQHQNDSEFL